MQNNVHPGIKVLQVLMMPVVRWAVRLGVGHGQFSRAIKPLFFQAAQNELTHKGVKCTESALSLASGLHRGDISAIILQGGSSDPYSEAALNRINPGSQVIARWVAMALPREIPLRGGAESFAGLVRACQRDGAPLISAKLLLQDLERRGLVAVHPDHVQLLSQVGVPNIDTQESVLHLFVSRSIDRLHTLSREWWLKALQELGQEAIALSERDEPSGGTQRLRLGVYFYTPEALSSSLSFHSC